MTQFLQQKYPLATITKEHMLLAVIQHLHHLSVSQKMSFYFNVCDISTGRESATTDVHCQGH